MTKQQITKMLNDGDVDARKVTDFFEAVRQFYGMATAESLAKLPLDKLLLHARFVDFFRRKIVSLKMLNILSRNIQISYPFQLLLSLRKCKKSL